MGTSTFRRSQLSGSSWRTILWFSLPELFRVFNMQRLILTDGPFCSLVKERLGSSVRMVWVSGGVWMAIRLHFWGAAQTVTGSSHHLECAGQNVLLDCGLFQGHRQQAREINEHLALPAEQLNAVVLSHAHIDHSGNLPLLVKQGYRGPIYTTPSTVDLCEKMLKDSAHIQDSYAEFVNRRMHRRRSIGVAANGDAVAPLYTQADAGRAGQQL